MKKPLSDTEFHAEQSSISWWLEKQQYKSAEWHSDAGITNRGLGVREVDDPNVSNQKQDTLPEYGK